VGGSASPAAFVSYARDDDGWTGGVIGRIVADLEGELSLIAGERRTLWMDRGTIGWGEDFESRIEQGLFASEVFLPFLTPAYFRSEWCRRELQTFLTTSERLGLDGLVLPIYFVTIDGFDPGNDQDPLVRRVAAFDHVDWRQLRLGGAADPDYRRTLARMAAVISQRRAEADAADPVLITADRVASGAGGDDASGAPPASGGPEDLVGEATQQLARLRPLVEERSRWMGAYADALDEAAATIRSGRGEGRITAATIEADQRLAERMHPIVEGMREAARAYVEQAIVHERVTGDMLALVAQEPQLDELWRQVLEGLVADGDVVSRTLELEEQLAAGRTATEWSKVVRPLIDEFGEALTISRDGDQLRVSLGNRARALLAQT
jgi:hypothetical protein